MTTFGFNTGSKPFASDAKTLVNAQKTEQPKFDTNHINFFAKPSSMQPAPVTAPDKTRPIETPEEAPKKQEPKATDPSIFIQAREQGKFTAPEDKPKQGYDGHKFGGKLFVPFC